MSKKDNAMIKDKDMIINDKINEKKDRLDDVIRDKSKDIPVIVDVYKKLRDYFI